MYTFFSRSIRFLLGPFSTSFTYIMLYLECSEHRKNYSWRYQELYSYNSFFGKLIFFYVTKTKIGFEIFKEFRKRKWFWKYLNRNFQIQFGNDWKFEKNPHYLSESVQCGKIIRSYQLTYKSKLCIMILILHNSINKHGSYLPNLCLSKWWIQFISLLYGLHQQFQSKLREILS